MYALADEEKVQALMESIEEIGLQEPVSVEPIALWLLVLRPSRAQGTFKTDETATHLTSVWSMDQIDVLEVEGKFYGFSGCHRYEVRWLFQDLICAADAVYDSRAALQCRRAGTPAPGQAYHQMPHPEGQPASSADAPDVSALPIFGWRSSVLCM